MMALLPTGHDEDPPTQPDYTASLQQFGQYFS